MEKKKKEQEDKLDALQDKVNALHTALCGNEEGAKGFVEYFNERIDQLEDKMLNSIGDVYSGLKDHVQDDSKAFNNITHEFKTNNEQREQSKQDVFNHIDNVRNDMAGSMKKFVKEISEKVQPVVDYQQSQKTIMGFANKTFWIIVGTVGWLITTAVSVYAALK